VSVLDSYDSLPNDEKQIIGAGILYRIKENKKAIRAAVLIPEKVRRFYEARFGLGIGNRGGEFIGFFCSSCNKWIECGHKPNCPVSELAGDMDYAAIKREIEKIRAGGEGVTDE
jgi:hypothetical protein